MEIIIVAVVVVAITGLGFILYDKQKAKQARSDDDSTEQAEEDVMAKPSKVYDRTNVIDYSVYVLSKQEYILAVVVGAAIFFLIGYLFYMNSIVALIFSLFGFIFPKFRRIQLRDKRKNELTLQFKNMLFSLSSALSAGNSVERALRAVSKDLELLYPNPDTYIIQELNLINRRIANGDTVEEAIRDFSDRADLEDIRNFADVFTTSTKTGGDLVEIISRTSTIISEKLEIQQEIQVLISGKQLESKILIAAPFGLIGFMTYAADGYMDPLFQFPGAGPVIMTVCLGVLIFVFWLLQKIMDIKV